MAAFEYHIRLNRRTFITLLGCLSPGAAQPDLKISSYKCSSRRELLDLHQRLRLRPGLYFEAIAADHMPQLLAIRGLKAPPAGLFELRSFESPINPSYFRRAAIPVLFNISDPKPTYFLRFADLAARQTAWSRFYSAAPPFKITRIALFRALTA